MDPYFPFEEAVDVWARTFAGLGIRYKGACMRLDLCDRPGKYSNGFCHWPQPAWRRVTLFNLHLTLTLHHALMQGLMDKQFNWKIDAKLQCEVDDQAVSCRV